jgi:mycothiol synthase
MGATAAMDNVIVRAPTLDDAHGVAALIAERDRADFAEVDSISFTGDELREWWRLDEALLETDAWIALAGEEVVAYARIRRERDLADVVDESCVHPKARGLGLGSNLLDLAEGWARDQGLARIQMHVVNDDGRRLAEGRGHELVRYFWRMEIDLTDEPSEPAPPVGMTLRSYRPGDDDKALHSAHQEAFAEHWEFTPEPLDEWLKWRLERGDYLPELWRVATVGEEIAGAALCFGERHQGWVLDLFVGQRWRRKGLGLALLQSGFRALWRRGHKNVGLEVDAENEAGATRLYERAGMRITRRYATYEKALSASHH